MAVDLTVGEGEMMEFSTMCYICPVCSYDNILSDARFCGGCGSIIRWKDEDDN